MDGVICQWHDKKGYGFIRVNQAEQQQYFFHISNVRGERAAIQDGLRVSFRLDSSGTRGPSAVDVVLPVGGNAKVRFSRIVIYAVVPLLLLSLWALVEPWLVLVYWLMSFITYIAYFLDKNKAQQGQWRISESSLHLFELLGGWPGALAAQRVLRHKIRKLSYQLVFWLIVTSHVTIAGITVIDSLVLDNQCLDWLRAFISHIVDII